jgi:hypothetical protein
MSKDARSFLTLPSDVQGFAYGMLNDQLKKEVDDLRVAKSVLDLPPNKQKFTYDLLSTPVKDILKNHGRLLKGVSKKGKSELKLPTELIGKIEEYTTPYKGGSRKRSRKRRRRVPVRFTTFFPRG